ncbi:MAG: hypothetical protein LIP23_06865, partial [Planctomycetes bacterium]|nr:hypothetical protein [Planctomycetota bacterium]
ARASVAEPEEATVAAADALEPERSEPVADDDDDDAAKEIVPDDNDIFRQIDEHIAKTPHMEYFSSDMLDNWGEEPPPAKPAKPAPVSAPAEERPSLGLGKKKRGKSGALAKQPLRKRLIDPDEKPLTGSVSQAAKLPQASSRPGIIALYRPVGPPSEADLAKVKPSRAAGKKSPAKTKSRASAARSAPVGRETDADQYPETLDPAGGIRVLGVEPELAKSQIGVVVPADSFDPLKFDFMTLIIKSHPEQRFKLRRVGTGALGKRMVLKLKAADSETAGRAAEAYLAAGEAIIKDSD